MGEEDGLEDVLFGLPKRQIYLLIVLFVGLLFIGLLRGVLVQKRRNTVLLLGASGSGKTTLFYQLRDGSLHAGTVPSMQDNKDTVSLKAGKERGKDTSFELIDIPGHPKVRGNAVQFYSAARTIVFLVDAVDFMAQKTMVAEHLYEILSDPTIQKKAVPILLVCNKTDEGARAHTADFIRKRLEKELEALRSTRATLGEGAAKGQPIAKAGEIFTFAGLKSPKVSILSASALKNDIEELRAFLR